MENFYVDLIFRTIHYSIAWVLIYLLYVYLFWFMAWSQDTIHVIDKYTEWESFYIEVEDKGTYKMLDKWYFTSMSNWFCYRVDIHKYSMVMKWWEYIPCSSHWDSNINKRKDIIDSYWDVRNEHTIQIEQEISQLELLKKEIPLSGFKIVQEKDEKINDNDNDNENKE